MTHQVALLWRHWRGAVVEREDVRDPAQTSLAHGVGYEPEERHPVRLQAHL